MDHYETGKKCIILIQGDQDARATVPNVNMHQVIRHFLLASALSLHTSYLFADKAETGSWYGANG